MLSEWMKVMLEEIERKRSETHQAEIEEQTRARERSDASRMAVRPGDLEA